MPPMIIKRYPNRKLYDTVEKQYITLERVAELIGAGAELQVVDYASGEDLTAVTLAQIIFEQEKKQSGFLPMPLLTGLVRAGSETVDSVRRTLGKSLESRLHGVNVDGEIERRLAVLVEQGELLPQQAAALQDKLAAAGRQLEAAAHSPGAAEGGLFERAVGRVLAEVGAPSRSDYERLRAQVELLGQKIDDIGRGPTSG